MSFEQKPLIFLPIALFFELTSRPQKIEAFIEAMRPFGIKEMGENGSDVNESRKKRRN